MPDDYKVGYKHPPKTAQFQKGKSGNPRGRPKHTRNLKTDLAEELSSRISITVQGKVATVSKQKAVIMASIARSRQRIGCRPFSPVLASIPSAVRGAK
jgi:hypothetical protein